MSTALSTSVETLDFVDRDDVSVEEYHRMIDRGELPENGRFELLRGRIVEKMTKKPPHCVATDETADSLAAVLPSGWCVRTQDPITLEDSEPEPDVVVAKGKKRDYSEGHPGASDVPLVIEVALSSLKNDRIKASIYAAAGVPQYWIVNLISDCVEVMSRPQGEIDEACYATIDIFESGQSVPVVMGDETVGEIPVDNILP